MIRDYFPSSIESDEFLNKFLLRAYQWREDRALSPPLVIIQHEVISLKPSEIAERISKWKSELEWEDSQLDEALNLLKQCKCIDFRKQNGFLLVDLLRIPVEDLGCEFKNDFIPVKKQLTLRGLLAVYLDHLREHRKPKTLENAKRVTDHAVRIIGDIEVSKLRRSHLDEYIEKRSQMEVKTIDGTRPIRSTTINIDIRSLKAMMNWAVEMGYAEVNPFLLTKQLKVKTKRTRPFSYEEMKRFLAEIEDPVMWALFVTAFLTGMRRGELVFLRWSNVDLKKLWVHIRNGEDYRTKFDKERDVTISMPLKRILENLPNGSEYVFANDRGEPFREDYLTKKAKKYLRQAGLSEELHLHSTRATTASVLGGLVAEPFIIKEALGHSHVFMSEKYITPPEEKQREAMNSVAEEILPRIENRAMNTVDRE